MKLAYLSALAVASTVAGQVMLNPNADDTKCLDVRDGILNNGTAVQIVDCHDAPSIFQMWELQLGKTSVRLANTDFCLDAGTTPGRGTPMKIQQCSDNLPGQGWFLTPDNRIALFNQGLCLDLTNGSLTNGNVVQTYTCTDGDTNQIWIRATYE